MKCIFIEGLPGSGKTSFAKRLYKDLQDLNLNVHSFTEGDAHPIDLAWIAIFNKSDINSLYEKFPKLVPAIQDNLVKEDGKYLLAYTNIRIDRESKGFYDYCEQFEIYQVNDLNKFLDTHIHRYETFVKNHYLENDIYIFECVLIQNHINELLINYRISQDEIHEYFNKLMKPFNDMEIQVLYIKQAHIVDTLKKITEQRRSTNKLLYKDWIDHVIDYVGRNEKYKGYNGVLQYFKERQSSEIELLKHLHGQVDVITLDGDYEKTYQALKMKVINY